VLWFPDCGTRPIRGHEEFKGDFERNSFNGLAFTLYDFLYLYCMKAYTHTFIKIKFIGILRLRIAEI